MSNDTSAPGFLTLTSTPVPYDDALVDLLQPIWAGVTGIPGNMFFPRWQPDNTPNMPDQDATWAAIGCGTVRSDSFHYETHVDSGAGYDYVQTTEEIDCLTSFYGPSAMALARQLKKGLMIAQNRVGLTALNASLVSVSDALMIPTLLAQKWQRRVDITVTIRRCVEEHFGVLTVLTLPTGSTASGLYNEYYTTPILLAPAP